MAVVRVEVALSREHVYVIGAAGIEPIQRGVSIAVSLAGNQSYARGVEIIGAECARERRDGAVEPVA